jgi:hypothetical protein
VISNFDGRLRFIRQDLGIASSTALPTADGSNGVTTLLHFFRHKIVTIENLERKNGFAKSCAASTMHVLAQLSVGGSMFLILALALAFGFECVNGFHDTANAVATVIYTNPQAAGRSSLVRYL